MLTPKEKSPRREKISSEEDGTLDAASSRTVSIPHYQQAIVAPVMICESVCICQLDFLLDSPNLLLVAAHVWAFDMFQVSSNSTLIWLVCMVVWHHSTTTAATTTELQPPVLLTGAHRHPGHSGSGRQGQAGVHRWPHRLRPVHHLLATSAPTCGHGGHQEGVCPSQPAPSQITSHTETQAERPAEDFTQVSDFLLLHSRPC